MSNNRLIFGRQIGKLELHFERYETAFQIAFTIFITIFPISFSCLISQGEKMNPLSIAGIVGIISFYGAVFCGWMLVRNSGKANQRKLMNIQNKLDTSNDKLDKLNELEETNRLLKDLINKIDQRWPK